MAIKKHDLGEITGVPTVKPKKIDGEWRFPLDVPIPEKMMRCPRCNHLAEHTDKKNPEGKTIFRCRNCHIEFFEGKKSRIAWCRRHQKKIKGKDCKKCHQFILHAEEWRNNNTGCPDCLLLDTVPEGFHKE